MKIIDLVQGLTFHKRSNESVFFRELKKILAFAGITAVDPCCYEAGDPLSVRILDNTLQQANGVGGWTTANITGNAASKITVSQSTSKVTTVVQNGSVGVVTTVALTDAADTSFSFTFTNSSFHSSSVVSLTALNSGNGIANVSLVSIGSGTAVIRVANVGTAAFNSTIKIHFEIL